MGWPEASEQNCCDNHWYGLYCHALGPEHWPRARTYYTHALKSSEHARCRDFIEWIDKGLTLQPPIPLHDIDNEAVVRQHLVETSAAEGKRGGLVDQALGRALELYSEIIVGLKDGEATAPSWHALRMINDVRALGATYDDLKRSVGRSGPMHNMLDEHGIPIPGQVRERSQAEPSGWFQVDGVRFENGVPTFLGPPAGPLPPLVTQDDCDVALWLAFLEGKDPAPPSFSLDAASSDPASRCRVDRKTFKPTWLAETAFGQSMFLADWIMKTFTMYDGLPSVTEPYVSGGSVSGWIPTALIDAIASAEGGLELPDGSTTAHGRNEIVVHNVDVARASYRRWLLWENTEYLIQEIHLTIESSLFVYEQGASEKHFRENDPTTLTGARGKILAEHYDVAAEQFPVFFRVKQLLGIFATLCQARRDGVTLAGKEKRRLEQIIAVYKDRYKNNPGPEYSPKPFHRGGCFCFGGVSGRTNATVAQTQAQPFHEPPHTVDFLVSRSGFTSPVPDGGSGPHPPRGSGVAFKGGSGGKGFHPKTTDVFVMDPNIHQGARTYYINISNQKVDPFTGRTIDPDHPYAHIYHDKNIQKKGKP